jgi:Flp pilus assembly pilin Flp
VRETLRRLFHNPDGQSVVEYGLLLSLIVLVIVTMLTAAHGRPGGLIPAAAVVAAPR